MSTLEDLVEVVSEEPPGESEGEGGHNSRAIQSTGTKAWLRKQEAFSSEIRFKRA